MKAPPTCYLCKSLKKKEYSCVEYDTMRKIQKGGGEYYYYHSFEVHRQIDTLFIKKITVLVT